MDTIELDSLLSTRVIIINHCLLTKVCIHEYTYSKLKCNDHNNCLYPILKLKLQIVLRNVRDYILELSIKSISKGRTTVLKKIRKREIDFAKGKLSGRYLLNCHRNIIYKHFKPTT